MEQIPVPADISYSQHLEDIVLDTILRKVEKGFYVDVGANHPTQHSVTKRFYDKGWCGINVEPNPRLYNLIKENRPRDINLNVGISDKEGQLDLRLYHSRDGLEGLSTFSTQIKNKNSKELNEDNKKYSDIKVPIKTLGQILSENKVKNIDFMKVDVEGLEYEVLAGNDWQKFRPTIICIEANHIVNDWHEILGKAKYSLLYNDGLNEYFVADENEGEYEGKDIVGEIVIASANIISPEVQALWKEDRKDAYNLREMTQRQQTAIDQLNKEIKVLHRQNSLSLKDQTILKRIKRASYGLTIDWARYILNKRRF